MAIITAESITTIEDPPEEDARQGADFDLREMQHNFLKSLEQFYQKMQSMLFSDIFHNLLNKFYQKNAVNTFCRSAPLLFTMS